jgi:hypothetical protein
MAYKSAASLRESCVPCVLFVLRAAEKPLISSGTATGECAR